MTVLFVVVAPLFTPTSTLPLAVAAGRQNRVDADECAQSVLSDDFRNLMTDPASNSHPAGVSDGVSKKPDSSGYLKECRARETQKRNYKFAAAAQVECSLVVDRFFLWISQSNNPSLIINLIMNLWLLPSHCFPLGALPMHLLQI